MTEPTNPDPAEGADDAAEPSADTELSARAAADLRALLRDESVEDDELARERRIRAALDAFAPAAAVRQGPVPAPRRRNGRALLVAAAVLAVVGVGGLFVTGIARSGGDDSASMESADSAATTTVSGAAADGAPDLPASAEAEGGSADGVAPPSAADSAEATSTVPLDRAQASTAAVADLGAHVDEASLLAAIAAGTADLDVDTPRSNDAAVLPCVAQQRAAGVVVLGVATVDGQVVVVIDAPAGPQLLDPLTCTAR